MSVRKQIASTLFFSAILATAAIVNIAHAGAREEGRLLTATEVLEEVQAMPDQQIPDALLSRAYGIAVIPDVTKGGIYIRRSPRQRCARGARQIDVPLEQSGSHLADRR